MFGICMVLTSMTVTIVRASEMYTDSKAGLSLDGPFFQGTTAVTKRMCGFRCLQAQGCAAYQWDSTSHACSLTQNVSLVAVNTTLVAGFNRDAANIELHGECYDLADGFKYFSSNVALINGDKYSIDPDTQLTASASYSNTYRPALSRLHEVAEGASWVASGGAPWIQADLGEAFYIGGVDTQGRANDNQWVTKFTLSYTLDTTFTQYTEGGVLKEFDANADRNTVVRNWIAEPFQALRVRLHPTAKYSHYSMRWELYGGKSGPGSFINIQQDGTFYCQQQSG